MPRRLFRQVDPSALERYTKKNIPRRRKMPQAKVQQLSFLRRALQSLPPRELQMLYLVKVQGIGQEEARRMYYVRQSNVSYRLQRTHERITLHNLIYSTVSETQLRRKLLDLGFQGETVRVILGVVKTSSQSATSKTLQTLGLNMTQGSVRYIFSTAIDKMSQEAPNSQELRLLCLIERNYNQLRCIQTQERWEWKKRGSASDLPTTTSPNTMDPSLV
jgi:CRISPR/Cas system-associated protein endoribonuclease Cas2